jgi:hypothetical protein
VIDRLKVPHCVAVFMVTSSLGLFQLMACTSERDHASSNNLKNSSGESSAPIVCATEAPSPNDLKNLNYGPTCSQVSTQYPVVLSPKPEENKKVLCPFLRMIERTGVWKDEIKKNLSQSLANNLDLPVTIKVLIEKALDFGCGETGCKPVAVGVSAGQQVLPLDKINNESIVDIGKLTQARGTAHDCGYTFGLGETEVNPIRRAETLAMLKDRAKNSDQLTLNDLIEVKKTWCKRDYEEAKKTSLTRLRNKVDEANLTLVFSQADTVEFLLIWSFLGGVERGFIRVGDVEDFLHARLPAFKTKYLLDGAMQNHLLSIIMGPKS